MGATASTRRIHTNHVPPQPPGYPNGQPIPNGHIPQYYNPNSNVPPELRRPPYPQFYPNGQYVMNMLSGNFNPGVPHGPVPPPIAEQKVIPIKNEVNVNKSTIHLEKDEANPGYYLVAFTFDALVSGSICIFFHAKEGPDFSLIGINQDIFRPIRIPFEKGLSQKFVQPSGTGVNLSAFDVSDLSEVKYGEVYPLILRVETNSDSAELRTAIEPGAALPKHVGAQTTNCVLEMKDGEYHVKVIKQIIWVQAIRYELQEIYGIESVEGGGDINPNDLGKECVICLSEKRNTTVLPCRHMCMCNGCAKLLQQRTNRCPICRTPVKKLLEIEIPEGTSEEQSQEGEHILPTTKFDDMRENKNQL